MRKVKVDFVEGAIKTSNAKKEVAELFWDQLEEFANYCFNKSHAACYGLIAYWTAYLKAHYPDAFMAALMTSDHDDVERLAIEITECKHMGIEVLAPDVDGLLADLVLLGGYGHGCPVGFPKDLDHLLFSESALPHRLFLSD